MNKQFKITAWLLSAGIAACALGAGADEPKTPTADEYIGDVTMMGDGTIVWRAIAKDKGMRAEAVFTYPRKHKKYKEMLEHIWPIKPGEHKPMPPFVAAKKKS